METVANTLFAFHKKYCVILFVFQKKYIVDCKLDSF